MKTKNKIRNILIRLAVLGVLIYSTHKLVSGSGKEDIQAVASQPSIQTNPTETPSLKTVDTKPWTFDRQTINPKDNSKKDWSIPTTDLTQPTDWFNVENVNYWGYRVKSDCLIEYKFNDETRKNVIAKMEWKTSNHYTEGTTDLWTSKKVLEIVDNTAEIRFLPLPDQSLVKPTIYKSE